MATHESTERAALPPAHGRRRCHTPCLYSMRNTFCKDLSILQRYVYTVSIVVNLVEIGTAVFVLVSVALDSPNVNWHQ